MPKASSSRLWKKRAPSPVQSSDSEADDDELEQLDKLTISYPPNLVTQWSPTSRLSRQLSPSVSSMRTRLLADVVDANESPFLPPIDTLPPEILIHILRQLADTADLYSCLLVSPRWCECSVELLWLKPHFSRPDTLFNLLRVLENQDTTFAYASFIRRLNFSSVSRELDDTRFAVLAACTRLERLTLNGCERLTDEALIAVLSHTSNLVALDLTNVCDVTDKTIAVLAATSPKLQGVNLEGCKKITDEGILALARSCPSLRRIKLCELEEVTSLSISELVSKCPLLIEIDLTQCSCIMDLAARDIWKNSFQLRELRLGQCFHITDQGFPVTPRLAQLPANTSSTAQGMENNLANVRYQNFPPLLITQPLVHLRQLDLMHLNITDDAVDGIIVNAPKIRNLVLAKCTALTDKAVKSICNLGRHLHCLHLGHAAAITDESVILLAKSCPRLRYVDLACCPLLTDESVRHLAALPKLRRIGLVRVVNLTDKAVNYLGIKHNTIERVHLSYCDKITVLAIHRLLQRSPRLTHLSLTGVPAFRKQELQSFCRQPPPYFNEIQRSQFCVYSGSGVNHLRKYLETTIYDPRIAELVEDELEDMTPSDADDTSAEPYLEGEVTMNDSAFTPYSIAPHEISSRSRGYTLPAQSAAPLPPSQQLHRTQASTGNSRSRSESSRQNRSGLYSTTPPAEMEHLGAPCWVAPGVTQDSRGSWQTSQYVHNEGPYVPHRGSLPIEIHRMERNDASRGDRRRRTGHVSSAGGAASSRTTQLASSGELDRVAEQASHSSRQHRLRSSVDARKTVGEAAPASRGHTPPRNRWNEFDSPASTSGGSTPVGSLGNSGASTSAARRQLQDLNLYLRPHQFMASTSPLGSGTGSGFGPESGSWTSHAHARHPGRTQYAAAGSTVSSRTLPVAGTLLLRANGDNASDSSATSREREKDADGGDEEIDVHDRRSRNRDSDATVKGLRSDSLRRGSITDGRSPSPASPHGTRPKKGIRGALSSAEQYASTLLFGGKGKARDQSPGGSRSRG